MASFLTRYQIKRLFSLKKKKKIPLPNADKDGFHDEWYPGRNFGDLIHPFKLVTAGPPGAGKTTVIMNIFLRIQLSEKPFENLH